MIQVFIDGSEGTTGLRIRQRLQTRSDIALLEIDPDLRKDEEARAQLLNAADVAILCLPDDAARRAVELVTNKSTIIIDASTAHRTQSGWAYGLPELGKDYRRAIASGGRIVVPGCHATGFISLVYPLVSLGLMPKYYPVTCHSVTGYSGGGNRMIADYADPQRAASFETPRQYAMGLAHKHLPEMMKYTALSSPPVFNPIVGDYYAGMAVSLPLHTRLLADKPSAQELHGALAKFYAGEDMIQVAPFGEHPALSGGFLDPSHMAGKDTLEILVTGHGEQAMLVALFDNLGKGASGAAVQCMNIACGIGEHTGLCL